MEPRCCRSPVLRVATHLSTIDFKLRHKHKKNDKIMCGKTMAQEMIVHRIEPQIQEVEARKGGDGGERIVVHQAVARQV